MIAGLLILIPLLAALLLLLTDNDRAKQVACAASLAEFAVTMAMLAVFHTDPASPLLSVSLPWVESSGINFAITIDGISLLMVLLTTFLVPLIILSSKPALSSYSNKFFSLVLLMEMALVSVFMARDGFLFYVCWELALIPIYFICLLWGGEGRARITFKFFVYTLAGSLLMLIGLIYLYLHTEGPHSFAIESLYKAGASLPAGKQAVVFWCIFLAFAVKMPVFPFHTWQPDTYTNAPTQGTMLLSGIMLKMGTFGLLIWLLPMVPQGVEAWGYTALVLSVTGIIYASCLALVQHDVKRLIAYSSIAHVGLISAGILSGTPQGIEGALLQMLNHGFVAVGLFLVADILFRKTGTLQSNALGSIASRAPWFATAFMIIMLSSVAFPLTSGFVGEFLLLMGVYAYNAWAGAFAALSVILGAVYMLRMYQRVMYGEAGPASAGFTEIDGSDKVVLGVIILAILWLGIYPEALMQYARPAVEQLIHQASHDNLILTR